VFLGRKVRLRGKSGISLGKLSAIGDYSYVDGVARNGVRFGVGAKLGRFATITSTSHLSKLGQGFQIGDNSGIGDFAHVGCSGGVTIGKNVIIGPFVTFHSQEHNSDRVDIPIRDQGTREAPIVLEDDIWVGSRVTFLAGTTIGRGSIVAAGSVVRSSFPEHSIIGGVPAKLLKTRSDDEGN
jgi:acetyltransferase-like isoleucine patch superfamily enzyme